MLTFSELRAKSESRASRWHGARENLAVTRDGMMGWSLSDWFTACAGELGEAGNVIKKLNRFRDGMVGNRDASVTQLKLDLGHEIADTLIYLDLLANAAGINLEREVITKFNIVSARNGFPERLSDES